RVFQHPLVAHAATIFVQGKFFYHVLAAPGGYFTKHLITEVCRVHNEQLTFEVTNRVPLLESFVRGWMATAIHINSTQGIHPVRLDNDSITHILKIKSHHVGHEPGRTSRNTLGLWRHLRTIVI